MRRAPDNVSPPAEIGRERHAALAARAAEDTEELPWIEVAPGVEERLVERIEAPTFRQTRLVKLARGAELTLGAHEGGDDLYVIEGALELCEPGVQASHAAGTFVGLPPGDRPQLSARWGCTLFHKARPTARASRVVVNTKSGRWDTTHTPGFWGMPLDEQIDGRVVLLRFDPQTRLGPHRHSAGEEFFVLSGSIDDERGSYREHWWVRQPRNSSHSVSTDAGCVMLTTAGHL